VWFASFLASAGVITAEQPLHPGSVERRTDPEPWRRVLTGDDAKRVAELGEQFIKLRQAGKYVEARVIGREILEIRTRVQGADHWQVVRARWWLAKVEQLGRLPVQAQADLVEATRLSGEFDRLFKKKDYANALPLIDRVLGICRRHLGADSYDVAALTVKRAAVLHELGQYSDAERLNREALRIFHDEWGEDDVNVIPIYKNLGHNLNARGKYGEAELLFRKALKVCCRDLGKQDLGTAGCYDEVGNNLRCQGRFPEAEEAARQALAIRSGLLDEEHQMVAESYNQLSIILDLQGRHGEAELLFRKALSIFRRRFGDEHIATADVAGNLAVNLGFQGRYAEAEPLLREALSVRCKFRGEEHPDTLRSYSNMATNLLDQGKCREAESLLQKVRSRCLKVFGEEHPDTIRASMNLAATFYRQEKYADSEALLRRVLLNGRGTLNDSPVFKATVYGNLAKSLQAQAKFGEAATLASQSLIVRREVCGEEHPDTADTYWVMALNLFLSGNCLDAEPLCRRGLALQRRLLGEKHRYTIASQKLLGDILHAQGKDQEAEAMWTAAARGFEVARLRVGSSGLERSFVADRSPLPALVACLARKGNPSEAWKHLEHNLARGLLDEWSSRIARPLDVDEKNREAELLAKLDHIDQQIIAIILAKQTSQAGGGREQELQQQRHDAQTELAQMDARAAAQEVYDLERLQAHLPADTALLVWMDIRALPRVDREHRACLVRHREPPRWVTLPGSGPDGAWTRDDDELPHRVRKGVSQRPRDLSDDATSLIKRLSAQRLGPLQELLQGGADVPPVKHLVILPSPEMAGIPIEILTDSYTLSYAPSATMFARLREGRREAHNQQDPSDSSRLLTLGDPILSCHDIGEALARASGDEKASLSELHDTIDELPANDKETQPPAASEPGKKTDRPLFAALPGSRREVNAIAALFPRSDRLLGSEASAHRLDDLAATNRLREYRFIHIATHAVMDTERHLQSALILTQEQPSNALQRSLEGKEVNDGRLTAERILRTWKLDADLVTLSACQTALGKYSGGEGYVGFSQALLLAGARSLVLSLWKVDDTATALLMTRFYQNLLGAREDLHQPLPKAKALAEAKQWLRSLTETEVCSLVKTLPDAQRGEIGAFNPGPTPAATRPFEHAYYWSAFILIGDPGDLSQTDSALTSGAPALGARTPLCGPEPTQWYVIGGRVSVGVLLSVSLLFLAFRSGRRQLRHS
jgi:CHAT domain-containing protein